MFHLVVDVWTNFVLILSRGGLSMTHYSDTVVHVIVVSISPPVMILKNVAEPHKKPLVLLTPEPWHTTRISCYLDKTSI